MSDLFPRLEEDDLLGPPLITKQTVRSPGLLTVDRLTHPSSLHSSDAPWRWVELVVTMPAAGASRSGSQQCQLQHLMFRVSVFVARCGHWSQLGVSSMGV